MYSPVKLCPFENNYLKLGTNIDLANKLQDFFKDPANDYLWKISTTRQRVTQALRHTECVMLRQLKVNTRPKNTVEFNQIMETVDTDASSISLFKDTVKWMESCFNDANVEWGRIFFSNHHASTQIDLHTDEGAYFSYYDRFHFVVQSEGDNIFHIRDEDVRLERGSFYWVNNHVPHWLANNSTVDRINLIADARLT